MIYMANYSVPWKSQILTSSRIHVFRDGSNFMHQTNFFHKSIKLLKHYCESKKRLVLGLGAEASVTAICLLLVLIKLIFATVLPQRWMWNKTTSMSECVSKGVWLLLYFSSCGCSARLSGVLCLMTSLSCAPAPCCCTQTTTIPPWFYKEHQGTVLFSPTVVCVYD